MPSDFQDMLRQKQKEFIDLQKQSFPDNEILKADLHCHDFNSDEPDELLGRILNTPETWITSETLLRTLIRNDCTAYTITNHNNARSCYQLQDKGFDILTAAEFSCREPDFGIGIHVLTYGFTPQQEAKLNKLRKNLYHFLQYTREHNIPTIWAHPLYHYSAKTSPPLEFFNKMMLLFERFEALNGQRDTWQNILVQEWVTQMSPELIDQHAKAFNVDPSIYCVDPYRKLLSGGSDCHMGMFSGSTGTYLYVPNLQERLKKESKANLMLEAIQKGNLAPYGRYQYTEKMSIALLSFACQQVLYSHDPGLMRLLLHKGNPSDKFLAFLVANTLSEIKRHNVTNSFVKIFLGCMMGEKPPFLKKIAVNSTYKPIFKEAENIFKTYKRNDDNLVTDYYNSILNVNNSFYNILAKRLAKKLSKTTLEEDLGKISLNEFIEKLELPASLRSYLNDTNKGQKQKINLEKFLDGLSFPFLGAAILLAAHFAATKTLFNARPTLRAFSKHLGKYEHPKRIMWLTDTFADSNGVSTFLQELHSEIKKHNLPIDIVVCSDTIQPDEHLKILTPVKTFSLPSYPDHIFNIPNLVEVHNLFGQGSYDRIICSTEGIMGLMGLYLKHAYTVEASFYLHTDWLMFARKTLGIEGGNLSRLRRILRTFYNAFDRVFVLNSDQKNWLSSTKMNLDPKRVQQTAHWVNKLFKPQNSNKELAFGLNENCKVLLYVGRVSYEKGVLELTNIYKKAKNTFDNVKLVVVGKGPAVKQLQQENPDAIFIDWTLQANLPLIYSSADLLLFPSRFDTFSLVVLESLSCGLPVIAYNTKGPKNIILDGKCGLLVDTASEMQQSVLNFLSQEKRKKFSKAAIERATTYTADGIINALLQAVGIER